MVNCGPSEEPTENKTDGTLEDIECFRIKIMQLKDVRSFSNQALPKIHVHFHMLKLISVKCLLKVFLFDVKIYKNESYIAYV